MSTTTAVYIFAFIIALAAFVGQARSDPYLRVTGGCIWSSDQSNQDQLEFGSECGGLGTAEAGYRFDLPARIAFDAGLEAAHRVKPIHGQNARGRATADHEDPLHLTSVMVNGRLSYRLFDGPVSVYGEGGFGGAHLKGLDDVALTPAWQVGGGLEFDIWAGLSAHAGYRHFEILETELDGNRTGADFHGAVVGFRWELTSFLDQLGYLADREPLED
ncbi:MAG: outer membrane beta-barrel protein [Kiloniellales bacterium]|nr:outer membrane beta-barrel protein [Kiloniellales bacterium]